MASAPPGADAAGDLARIAATLNAVASSVGEQATAAAAMVHEAADHARRTAILASELVRLGELVGTHLEEQGAHTEQALDVAGEGADAMKRVVEGAAGIEAIVQLIGNIASESRLLALNARIEAARAGTSGSGFGVVANAMSTLSTQTFEATQSVDDRTQALRTRLNDANRLFGISHMQAEVAREGLGEVLPAAQRQSEAAVQVRALADQTLGQVEQSALLIGRLTSAAVTVRVLGKQVESVAGRLRA